MIPSGSGNAEYRKGDYSFLVLRSNAIYLHAPDHLIWKNWKKRTKTKGVEYRADWFSNIVEKLTYSGYHLWKSNIQSTVPYLVRGNYFIAIRTKLSPPKCNAIINQMHTIGWRPNNSTASGKRKKLCASSHCSRWFRCLCRLRELSASESFDWMKCNLSRGKKKLFNTVRDKATKKRIFYCSAAASTKYWNRPSRVTLWTADATTVGTAMDRSAHVFTMCAFPLETIWSFSCFSAVIIGFTVDDEIPEYSLWHRIWFW